MSRNSVPRELLQKLLDKRPRTTINRHITKKLSDLNGTVSRKVAALLVAKDMGINFTKYVDDEDRDELTRVHGGGLQPVPLAPSRTLERKVTKEIKPLRGISPCEPYLPSSLLDEAKEMAEKAYPFLYIFENSVRNVIKSLMENKCGPNWWETRVKNLHKTIDDDVNRRMHEEKQNRWHSSKRGVHNIYYTDIDDLRIIVQDNWTVFRKIHDRQSWVVEHIMQLSYSRNIIAHNNPLKGRDIQSIQTKIFEWFDQIKGLPK